MKIGPAASTAASLTLGQLPIILAMCAAGLLAAAMNPHASREASLGQFDRDADVGVTPKPGSAAYDSVSRRYTLTGGCSCSRDRMGSSRGAALPPRPLLCKATTRAR